jgi:hypothetical protein
MIKCHAVRSRAIDLARWLLIESSVSDLAFEALGHVIDHYWETTLGVKKSGKGRRKQGRKKRRMRAKIRHRK